jgi:hypothetical protein
MSTNMTLSRFAAAAGLDADGVVQLVKQIAAQPTAAVRAAQIDNTLYTEVFGAARAAWDVPISPAHRASPPCGAAPATGMTQAEADALYETIWPQGSTETPDSLFGKAS